MTQPLPLLTTGINGLVGSRFAKDFGHNYTCSNVPDITLFDEVMNLFSSSDATHVVHLAAYTNVSGAWAETGNKNGLAYRVNVLGTQHVVKACEQTGKHLIHISTAYVFDGEKLQSYTESDPVHPLEWYGQTKAEAESIVQQSSAPWTILRIDQPFRSDTFSRPDVVHRIIEDLKQGTLRPQFTNHYLGPTFINDFVKVIDWVIRTSATGIYHASNGEKWSDFDFAHLINNTLQLGGSIQPGDLETYLQTSQRPYQRNTALDCTKLHAQIDFNVHTITEAIASIEA